MKAKVIAIKKARAPKRVMVTVDNATLYFPSEGDPNGEVHVVKKWHEALMMSQFLLAAIARSGISVDTLDLPGTAQSLKLFAEAQGKARNAPVFFPGPTMIEHAVSTIRATRDYLDEEHKKVAAAAQAAKQADHQPAEARALH